MDPKDLKNSEELKRNVPSEPEQRDDAVDAKSQGAKKTEIEKKEDQEKSVKTPDKSITKKTAKPPGKATKKKPAEKIKQEKDKPEKEVEEEPKVAAKKKKTIVAKEAKIEKPVEEKVKKTTSSKKAKTEDEVQEEVPEVKAEKEIKKETTKSKEKEEVVEKPVTAVKKEETIEKEELPKVEKDDITIEEAPVEIKQTEETLEKVESEDEIKETTPAEETIIQLEKEEAPVEIKQTEETLEKVESEDEIKEITPAEETTNQAEKKEANLEPEAVENAETKTMDKVAEVKEIDYTLLSQIELINALRSLIDENDGEDIKREVEAIKSQFYKLLVKEKEDAKIKFVDEGGDEEDYVEEENPYEKDIKDLLKRYRFLRIDYNKKQESVKEENLKLKYQIIEEIKNLINREESINKTFHEFRDLQATWRETGLVPQSKMKDLWDTYHFHVENFYNYIKINKELRDLDLKKNLELKLKLCERAEELLLESSIIRAFNALQKLHERWREIGPVPRDKKDEIWERFKSATSKINKKHQEYFESRKSEQKNNLDAKSILCEKAEEIAEADIKTHREWDIKSKELIELQKVWRTIGFAPKRDNNRIYERFRIAADNFFDNRREFYAKNKELQQNNLQMKIDMCVQAESLKDSTDWKKTTQDFISIQRKWKEIGPIPRKHSDQVWKRFRDACDYFFNMKSKHFSNIDGEQGENLKLKEELIKEVASYVVTKDVDEDLKQLKEFQRRWTEIGHIPIKQKEIVLNKFRAAINKHFDDLKLDDSKRDILKFKNKVSNLTETMRGKNKMRLERDKYMAQLKQMETDLILLDNNIGFFTKSKNAEALIADVNSKIERTREKIKLLKKKIRIINEYDND